VQIVFFHFKLSRIVFAVVKTEKSPLISTCYYKVVSTVFCGTLFVTFEVCIVVFFQ